MGSSSHVFDVIVVGAGPCGATAAALLGQRGQRVLLLDRDRFPRDKTCGDGVTFLCAEHLEALGIGDALRQGPALRAGGVRLVPSDGDATTVRAPRAVHDSAPLAYVLPRRDFDALVLGCARACESVSFLDRARVAATIRDARGRVRGVRVEGPQAGDYYADVIIDASGATSAIAREARLSPPGGPGHAVALRGYFEGDALRDDVIEFCFDAGVPRGYFWIFPLGDGVVNVGIAAYGGGAPLRPLLQRFLAGHGGGRLRGTRQRGALRGGTIPVLGDLASRVRDGLILAGDAAGFCDPLTFEGISYAMASGRLAAQAAAEALAEGSTAASVLQRYDGWWRERFGHYLLLLSELLRAPARATAGSPPRGSSFEAVFRRMMTLGAAA